MTLTLSEANSYAPANKEDSSEAAPVEPVKTTWRTLAKGFWAYTEATSEGDTKSFEGLL